MGGVPRVLQGTGAGLLEETGTERLRVLAHQASTERRLRWAVAMSAGPPRVSALQARPGGEGVAVPGYLVYPHRQLTPPKVRAFADFLARYFQRILGQVWEQP